MRGDIERILEDFFAVAEVEGDDKVLPLGQAIASYVKPGQALHIGGGANAAMWHIARRFWGTKPGFTIIMSGLGGQASNLVHGGLVQKVITTVAGSQPTPGPSPVVQRAYMDGSVHFESWSFLTLPLMLLAGALNVGFMPTQSIVGSTMAEENSDSFKVIDDPFGSGRQLGVVKALNPDLSLVHAWAADRYGNALLIPPYSESLWGVKASREGVVLTVERLVSTAFIRDHSLMVRLPGHLVRSVSVEPLGAHPSAVHNHSLPEIEAYVDDYDFQLDHKQATRDSQALTAWIREWVLEPRDRSEYLAKVGAERIRHLKEKATQKLWTDDLEAMPQELWTTERYNATEMMVIAAARKMRQRILERGYRLLFAGAGVGSLAAWLAKYRLQEEGHLVELIGGTGVFGYAPRPADPFMFNPGNIATCKWLTDAVDILGAVAGRQHNGCLAALGAAQIDRYGNINSGKIPGQFYISGAGGSNDVASSADEVMAVVDQTPARFLGELPYITAPGDRLTALISTYGVFEKLGHDRELSLAACYPAQDGASVSERVERAKKECGWPLKVAPEVRELPPPTRHELEILRAFDPKRYFLNPL